MSIDAFMYFEPTMSKTGNVIISGETTDVGGGASAPKAFEIMSFSLNSSNSSPEGGTSSHRTISVGSIEISKPFDIASCGLFSACTSKDCVFEKAVVLFRKLDGKIPFIYLKYVIKEVRIESVDWTISSVDSSTEMPDQEKIAVSFNSCDIFYSPQTEKGVKQQRFDGEVKKSASYSNSTGKS